MADFPEIVATFFGALCVVAITGMTFARLLKFMDQSI